MSRTRNVEHQLLGAADELDQDGDDVASVVAAAVADHVVGNLVDSQRAAALEEGVGLLGVVLVQRVAHEYYCVVNHRVFKVFKVND